MLEQHRLTELDSGVRVVTERIDTVRSVALGFWIGTGSAGETQEQAGLSHLIEHMLFRGTPGYASVEIDELFDEFGAELNASTGKETTSVYARVLDRHLEAAFDVMADMVWRPNLAQDDLETEREIVLEEIAMYEDDPQDQVFDVLQAAVFGAHPLGRAIIGRAEVVGAVSAAELQQFHGARYVPGNVVVAAAGSIDHDALVDLVQRTIDRAGRGVAPEVGPGIPDFAPRVRFLEKESEQYHVCLGAPGIPRDDERRFALRVLDNILGGTSSSRLFQEVREKRGLAYAVYSFSSQYAHAGQVGLYVGTRPDNIGTALDVIGVELERFRREPATAAELQRSKENVKGRVLLGLESTTARMNRLGASVLAEMPLLSVDEIEARIDAVTLSDLEELAVDLFAPDKLSVVGIGADEAAFLRAIGPVTA